VSAGGTSVAMETGDVALMSDELDKLPAAIRLARRAVRIVKANVALSLASIAALIAAALAGWLSLTTGLLLNEGMALLIIANGAYGPRRSQAELTRRALAALTRTPPA
jgi:Cd2+/Zn2+-exporting ATPase